MARPLRIQFNNAWYHVMNRGAAHQPIFLSENHRRIFLEVLADINDIYNIEIHAYCLMTNHYHLLVKTPLGNLSECMRHLNSIYTKKFNKYTKKDGALFRGRYKSSLVEEVSYLAHVSRYIHLNPIKAKLVNSLPQYQWSSYPAYLRKSVSPPWLTTSTILSYFGEKDFVRKYEAFVKEKLFEKDKLEDLFSERKWSPIIGDPNFKAQHYHSLEKSDTLEISDIKKIAPKLAAERIISTVRQYYNIDTAVLEVSPFMKSNKPRDLSMYLLRHYGKCQLREIAKLMKNISYFGVSKAISRTKYLIQNDSQTKIELDEILHLLPQIK